MTCYINVSSVFSTRVSRSLMTWWLEHYVACIEPLILRAPQLQFVYFPALGRLFVFMIPSSIDLILRLDYSVEVMSHVNRIRYKYASRLASSPPVIHHPSKYRRLLLSVLHKIISLNYICSHADATHISEHRSKSRYWSKGLHPTWTWSFRFFRQTISSKQSLECVQTLLKAGLGCISYLRCTYYGPSVLILSWSQRSPTGGELQWMWV